jgi:hypothetical protein
VGRRGSYWTSAVSLVGATIPNYIERRFLSDTMLADCGVSKSYQYRRSYTLSVPVFSVRCVCGQLDATYIFIYHKYPPEKQ